MQTNSHTSNIKIADVADKLWPEEWHKPIEESHDTRVDGEVKVKKRKKRKKRLFKLSAMNTLVDENSFLKNKYDKLSAGAEEKLGYHWNEVVQNILFNKFVKPEEKLMARYMEIKRRDEAEKEHKEKHHEPGGHKKNHSHDKPEPVSDAEVENIIQPQQQAPLPNPAGVVDTRVTNESTDTISAGNYQFSGPLVTTKGGMKAWMSHWESKIKKDKSGMTIIRENNMTEQSSLNEHDMLSNPSSLNKLFDFYEHEKASLLESIGDIRTDGKGNPIDSNAGGFPIKKKAPQAEGPEVKKTEPKAEGEIHDDCRDEAGVTVGLIDSLIFISRILAHRDLTDDDVQEALKDLKGDEDIKTVMSAITKFKLKSKKTGGVPAPSKEGDEKTPEEGDAEKTTSDEAKPEGESADKPEAKPKPNPFEKKSEAPESSTEDESDNSEGSDESSSSSSSNAVSDEPKEGKAPAMPKIPKAPKLYEAAGEKKPDALIQLDRLHAQTEKMSNGYYKKDQKERNLNMVETKDGGQEQKHDYDKDSLDPKDVKKHTPSKEEDEYVKLNRGGNLADRFIQGVEKTPGATIPDAFMKRMKDEAGADVVKDAQDKAEKVKKENPASPPPARVQTLKEGVVLTARYMTPNKRQIIAFNTSRAEAVDTINENFIPLETKGFGNDATEGAKTIIEENDFFINLGNNQIYSRSKKAESLNESVVQIKKNEFERYRHLIGYNPRAYSGSRK